MIWHIVLLISQRGTFGHGTTDSGGGRDMSNFVNSGLHEPCRLLS